MGFHYTDIILGGCTGMQSFTIQYSTQRQITKLKTRFNTTHNNEFIETLKLYFAYVSFSNKL